LTRKVDSALDSTPDEQTEVDGDTFTFSELSKDDAESLKSAALAADIAASRLTWG
jgi:hypothetical protein